ncbi:hypothetical protein LTR90_008109 [Exophiala xenobiotica]|nr:hypothetical protein LTR90_008109 [Exophiala xenobiotica]
MNNYSVFGFGRRLCPGAHIAERSLNIIVARVGWACNISKSVDQVTGRGITPPEYDYVKGMNTEPHEFPFELKSRSPERWKILEDEAQKATEALNQPII